MSEQQAQNETKPDDGQSRSTGGLEALRQQLAIQGQDGNWNYDPYMQGMYNGLECALATLENREPKYKTAPGKWLFDMPSVLGAPAEASNGPGNSAAESRPTEPKA